MQLKFSLNSYIIMMLVLRCILVNNYKMLWNFKTVDTHPDNPGLCFFNDNENIEEGDLPSLSCMKSEKSVFLEFDSFLQDSTKAMRTITY